MRRREFIGFIGGSAAWPLAVQAQRAMPVVGLLGAPAAQPVQALVAAMRAGLKETGYTEGENVAIEYRWAEGQYDRLPGMADDLVQRRVAAIVALAPPAASAAKKATNAIPIVFVIGADPVQMGLVASLNRPGGNVTGANFLINALGSKRLQIIRELMPTAMTVGLLINPAEPSNQADIQDVQQAAPALGMRIVTVGARSESDFEKCFATLISERASALVVSPDALFTSRREQLVALAAQQGMPVIYHLREAVMAGGLMSYGTSFAEAHRLAGVYAGRILKGANASELPVQQSTRFELVINLKTAKTLGITIPPMLLSRADEVVE